MKTAATVKRGPIAQLLQRMDLKRGISDASPCWGHQTKKKEEITSEKYEGRPKSNEEPKDARKRRRSWREAEAGG